MRLTLPGRCMQIRAESSELSAACGLLPTFETIRLEKERTLSHHFAIITTLHCGVLVAPGGNLEVYVELRRTLINVL